MSLAILAGHRGAAYLGDELGESLAKLGAPSKRRQKDLYGGPRLGDFQAEPPPQEAPDRPPSDVAQEDAGAPHEGPVAHTSTPILDAGAGPHEPFRTRGVFVPGSVVLAYAKRGAIPAVDTARGVVLRGVGTGNGLEDGDLVVRVGRAPVRSLREITGIVQASLFAGHTQLHGTVRRGEIEIDITVEIPTGGDGGL